MCPLMQQKQIDIQTEIFLIVMGLLSQSFFPWNLDHPSVLQRILFHNFCPPDLYWWSNEPLHPDFN